MNTNTIIELVTVFVTLILGFISKKSKFIDSKKIPIQNLILGIVYFIIDYVVSKDFNAALLFSGLLAGGTYDFTKNVILIFTNTKIEENVNELTFENEIEGVK